jgi:putative serine protease PepD
MQDNTRDSSAVTPSASEPRSMGMQTPAGDGATPTLQQPPAQAAPSSQQTRRRSPLFPLVLAGVVVALFGLVFGVGAINASSNTGASSAPSGTTIEETTINVIQDVSPSVVQIQGHGNGPGGSVGSGEILTTSGYIVTNDHVVHGFPSFVVLLADGRQLSASLVGEAPNEDLAVLKISASNLKPISVGDSTKVKVGEYDIALGSPLGLEQSATSGIVSALNREATEVVDGRRVAITGLIQTSAPINPGNSGGALVNLKGQLIGIPTLAAVEPSSGVAANGIGFAISSNRMESIVSQITGGAV